MAQRDREKAKRPASRASETTVSLAAAGPRTESRIKALERERDALKAELSAAHAKIAALDESRRQAANRIEWIIDSLHSLIDKDA